MSFKLVKRVIHTDRVDGINKLVLVILADYVNEAKGDASWPSVTTVALQAGLSVRHTRRIIRELENLGVLVTRRQAGLRGTNKYVIDVTPIAGADTHVLPEADIHDRKGGHPRPPRADTHVPRTDKEHIRTDTFDDGAGSARAPIVSLVNKEHNSSDVVRATAHDAPKCTEHTEHQNSCAICYAYQYEQWKKEGL